ncbi:MAG TPA: DUF2238 domain-containing protein, partial [Gemmatimonadaceae bacterium]
MLFVAGAAVFIWSGIAPFDRETWVMEIFPIAFALPVLYFTRARFPLTRMLYWLILLHAVILMVGGHYSYARVPLGFWMERVLGFTRNHYDRIGHIAQGFIPALIAREVLLRTSPLKRGRWLFFLVLTTCMAISMMYEFIEWWTAVAAGSGATEFLGTQGDVWDTQWDMFMATVGAILAQVTLARVQDRQLGN